VDPTADGSPDKALKKPEGCVWSEVASALVLVVAHGVTASAERSVLEIGRAEQRYVDVGRYVDAALPRGAIVLAGMHSGSVRLYSGRTTLRYNFLEGDWLDRAVVFLAGQGRATYAVLDDWEVPVVKKAYAGQASAEAFARAPLAQYQDNHVLVYQLGAPSAGGPAPAVIPPTTGCDCYPANAAGR